METHIAEIVAEAQEATAAAHPAIDAILIRGHNVPALKQSNFQGLKPIVQ